MDRLLSFLTLPQPYAHRNRHPGYDDPRSRRRHPPLDQRRLFISVEEAKGVKRHVENALGRVDGILVDNTGAGGTWPTEIDEVWGKLMQNIYGEVLPCATVAASAANAMHVNRLSRKNETDDLIRAFKPGEKGEALDFVAS